jgi:hypothetical protein
VPRGVVDFLEAVEIEQQQRGRAAIGDCPRKEPLAEKKARRLATPVSESVSAAFRCSSSARSFDIATRRNGRQKLTSSASAAMTSTTALWG